MPIHDWSKVDAGVFHSHHLAWVAAISGALNNGLLPANHYAMIERRADGPSRVEPRRDDGDGLANLAADPPRVGHRFVLRGASVGPEPRRVVVRRAADDRSVAVVEVVSPGNKSSRVALGIFVDRVAEALGRGLNLLVVDPHRPGRRDPQGIHGAIGDLLGDEPYAAPADRPLTLAAYTAGPPIVAYVEPIAVGDTLPPMPLFLDESHYLDVPLEETYRAAWRGMPRRWRDVLEPPADR